MSQKIPQVIFVGNGLVYSSNCSWEELIEKTSRDDIDVTKYKRESERGFHIPNTLLTLVTANHNDTERHEKYISTINNTKYDRNEYIDELLKLPIDAFLTTNYTYEIEYAIKHDYPSLKDKTRYWDCTIKPTEKSKVDAKYLIHTYNKIGDYPPIWHIHGEVRRKSSLILSHDEYARLVNKILDFNLSRGNDYLTCRDELKIKSWIDYFILGDIYILGCGFDFAEFDLWWLISRKLREKGKVGKIYFYEPISKNNKYKHLALIDIDVEVISFGIEIFENESNQRVKEKYHDFYLKAIDDIKTKIYKCI